MTLMIWWRPDHPSWHDVEWPTCLQNTIICTNYQQSCSGDGRVRGPKQTKVDRRCKQPKCDFMTEIKVERKVDTWKNDTDVQHREYKQDAGWDFRPRIVNDVFWLEKSMRVRTEDEGAPPTSICSPMLLLLVSMSAMPLCCRDMSRMFCELMGLSCSRLSNSSIHRSLSSELELLSVTKQSRPNMPRSTEVIFVFSITY